MYFASDPQAGEHGRRLLNTRVRKKTLPGKLRFVEGAHNGK
jgi:hypothetical protein